MFLYNQVYFLSYIKYAPSIAILLILLKSSKTLCVLNVFKKQDTLGFDNLLKIYKIFYDNFKSASGISSIHFFFLNLFISFYILLLVFISNLLVFKVL